MFLSTLPDLTPGDPHHLWYTARHAPTTGPPHLLTPPGIAAGLPHPPAPAPAPAPPHHPRDARDARRALLARTPLARLRHDEAVMDRRRANVADYGTQWLKPPGVAKTLFQLREERRELAEHREAARRERELALAATQMVAGAGAGDGDGEGEGEGAPRGTRMDEDGRPEVDLDDDVPEAEGFGFDGEEDSSDDEEEEEEEEEEEVVVVVVREETMAESEGGEALVATENNAGAVDVSPAEATQVRGVRAAEDRLIFRMAREDGTVDLGASFGVEAREMEMLEEDDLVNAQQAAAAPPPGAGAGGNTDVSMGMDMDMAMDADLDGGVPDGGGDEYEHTDSDEEVDEPTRDISFAGRSSVARPLRRSVHRGSLRSRGSMAPSEALDFSELLSGEGSSFLEASPYPRRRE